MKIVHVKKVWQNIYVAVHVKIGALWIKCSKIFIFVYDNWFTLAGTRAVASRGGTKKDQAFYKNEYKLVLHLLAPPCTSSHLLAPPCTSLHLLAPPCIFLPPGC